MKNKKLIVLGVLVLLIAGAIFYFKDNTDMKKVEKEHNESAEASSDEILDKLNNDTLGNDFDDIEEAPLAIDTNKAEK